MKLRHLICSLIIIFSLVAGGFGAGISLKVKTQTNFQLKSTLASFINTQKTIVAVRQLGNDTLVLTGLKPGTAYLYVWDINNQQAVLKISVWGSATDQALASIKKPGITQGRYELYFKSDPKNSALVNQRMIINKFNYQTDWAGYGLDFDLNFRHAGYTEKYDLFQLEKFYFRLSKNNNFLALGDQVIQYTPLTAHYLGLQGLQAKVYGGNYQFEVFSGKRPGAYWGWYAQDQASIAEEQSAIGGGRLSAKLNDSWKIGLTNLRRSEGKEKLRQPNTTVKALDTNWRWNNYIIQLENAQGESSSTKSTARQGSVEYTENNYGWNLAYRDIEPAYLSVSDYLWYRGARGYMFSGHYLPNKYLSFSGGYENYLQRFDQDFFSVVNDNYTIEKSRVRMNLLQLNFLRPSLTAFKSRGLNSRSSGYTLRLDQITWLSKYLTLYAEYSPWNFRYEYSEYLYTQAITGLQSTPLTWLTLRLEHSSETEYYFYGGQDNNPRGYNFNIAFGDFFLPFGRDLRFNFSYWFQNRKNSQETIDKNRHAVKLTLRQATSQDFFWYLNCIVAQENSLKFEYLDRAGYFYSREITQSEISGGLISKF